MSKKRLILGAAAAMAMTALSSGQPSLSATRPTLASLQSQLNSLYCDLVQCEGRAVVSELKSSDYQTFEIVGSNLVGSDPNIPPSVKLAGIPGISLSIIEASPTRIVALAPAPLETGGSYTLEVRTKVFTNADEAKMEVFAKKDFTVGLVSQPSNTGGVSTNIPVGGILMWYGQASSLPAGFELCDGSPITTTGALLSGVKPDFRGRFPRGATSEAPGSLGGANEVSIPATTSQETALSVAQLPMHNHGIGSHSHSIESHLHTASVNDSGHVHDIKIKEGDGDTISQDNQ